MKLTSKNIDQIEKVLKANNKEYMIPAVLAYYESLPVPGEVMLSDEYDEALILNFAELEGYNVVLKSSNEIFQAPNSTIPQNNVNLESKLNRDMPTLIKYKNGIYVH